MPRPRQLLCGRGRRTGSVIPLTSLSVPGHQQPGGGIRRIWQAQPCFWPRMRPNFIVVDESHLYSFEDSVSFEQAALAEPFSIASNVLERTGMTGKDQVVILGSGTIGLCTLQAAKGVGARVLVSDVVEEKLERARRAGADAVVNSNEHSLAEAVEAFAPGGADVVIDAVGIAALTEQMPDLAAPRARLAVLGFDEREARIPPVKITRKELTLVGSRMNCHQFPRVMEWLKEGKIDDTLMVTGKYPLEEIQKAFEETLGDKDGAVKTLILLGEEGQSERDS